MGDFHSCGVTSVGAVECWGNDGIGQASAPNGRFTQVSAGWLHSCGLTSAGAVECWGNDGIGQASAPNGRFTQVSAGYAHSCGLTHAGAVECWGNNSDDQASPPSGSFTRVSAGWLHSCGLTSAGAVECWGNNSDDQASPPSGSFTRVSAGWTHSCGLTSGGAVECWGSDEHGQASAPNGRFTQVSVSRAHSCGVTIAGAVQCWGETVIRLSGVQTRAATPSLAATTVAVRITALRHADGRIELALQPQGGNRILPRARWVPTTPTIDRWLHSSVITVDGRVLGRIAARRLPDGRTEFSFLPADGGDRVLPSRRYMPAGGATNWRHSPTFVISPPGS